jgi:hypothetical protein
LRRPSLQGAARWAARTVLPSGRAVLALPDWAGFGNQLYYYLHAFVEGSRGHGVPLLVPSARGRTWLERFPALRELTVAGPRAGLRDAPRTPSWDEVTRFGESFTRAELGGFVDRYLQPVLRVRPDAARDDTLVVNVRRGDFFSDPAVRGLMSMDQPAYLRVAVELAREQRGGQPWGTVTVVSDDPAWCTARLGFLAEHGPLDVRPGGDPVADLRTVASARELVIVNSTFSMWGAYVAGCARADAPPLVVVPAFSVRPFTGTPPANLDPRWTVVHDIPGGWDS